MCHCLLSVIFYFALLTHLTAFNEPSIIDLSIIDYSVNEENGEISIKLVRHPYIKSVKVKSCRSCSPSGTNIVKCNGGDLVQMNIDLQKTSVFVSVPFNVSCNIDFTFLHTFIVTNVETAVGTDSVLLTWKSPLGKGNKYLIYNIDSNGHYKYRLVTERSSYLLTNLTEKSWYQICIATVDKQWRTSTFQCKRILTDTLYTGPVTNIRVESESDRIHLTWNKPFYQYDNPQGYIVNITEPDNKCRLIIIEFTNDIIHFDISCPTYLRMSWPKLSTLEINYLSPYSVYRIEIFPINTNKTYIKSNLLSIKTKEGESEAVENLRASLRSSEWLFIKYGKPIQPHGIIVKYKIKIIQTKINICSTLDSVIQETYCNDTIEYKSVNMLKKCGTYTVEVSPINGWVYNNGIGKTASTAFNYDIDRKLSIHTDFRFVSQDSLNVHISNITSDHKCDTIGIVMEIVNSNNRSNCIVYIFVNFWCSEIGDMISSASKCRKSYQLKWSEKSKSLETMITGIFQNQSRYLVTVWRITNKLEKIMSTTLLHSKTEGCFYDCYQSGSLYSGIRSATELGNKCKEWKYSKTYSHYAGTESNLCSSVDSSKPWCPVDDYWEFCDIPNCSNITMDFDCLRTQSMERFNDSIRVKWFSPLYKHRIIGYLILLHDEKRICQQYHLQLCNQFEQCVGLDSQVKNFYLTCRSGLFDRSIKYATQFRDLNPDTQYIVYLIPIINTKNVGEISKYTVRTLHTKPEIPRNIRPTDKTPNKIELSWDKPINSRGVKSFLSYTVFKRKYNTSAIEELKVVSESVSFKDLEKCTKYCFTVRSENNDTKSDFSEEKCWFTMATKPSIVDVKEPKSEYSSNRLIEWSSTNESHCIKIYRVEYSINNGEKLNVTTYEKRVILENLKTNVTYIVRVRAENQMEAMKDQVSSDYSHSVEFYTGPERDVVENLQAFYHKSKKLLVKFQSPSRSKKYFIQYNVKIIQTKVNICTKINRVISETTFQQTYGFVPLNDVHCGLFKAEVYPIGNWDALERKEKTTSIEFSYDIDQESDIKVDAQFISFNSLSVRIPNAERYSDCQTSTFAIEVDEGNSFNCIVRILSNIQCPAIQKVVADKLQCSNHEFRKQAKEASVIETFFAGMFQDHSKYRINIWKIINSMIRKASISITNQHFKNCFTDCFPSRGFYTGIRSADRDGRSCIPWESSMFITQGYTRSNICSSSGDSKPWCPVKDSWQYCDIPLCSDILYGTGCVKIESTNEFTDSLDISWSSSTGNNHYIGYITLLHNSDHNCEQYHIQMCAKCDSITDLDIRVNNFYLSCQLGRFDQFVNYTTHFKNLHQNQQYFVYIFPIVNVSAIGEIANISVKTLQTKPIKPQNIIIKSKSLNEIKLTWDVQVDTPKHGKATFYIVTVKLFDFKVKEVRLLNESVTFYNLEFCSLYCFTISAGNDAGSSGYSNEICSFTLAPIPGIVTAYEQPTESLSSRIIKWNSTNENKCSETYSVQYWIRYSEEKFYVTSNKTTIRLENLKTNVTYLVKVRAENQMDTINNETIGEYSDVIEFFTGYKSDSVQSLNVTILTSDRVLIQFKKPSQSRGVIIKYKIEIIQTKINVCLSVNEVVYDSYFQDTSGNVSSSDLKKCGTFLVKVSPISGWIYNEGVGNTASTLFKYSSGNLSKILVNVKFISFNSLVVRLSNISNSQQCGIIGFAVEVINEKNPLNCLVKIFSNFDCPELRDLIDDQTRCRKIDVKKWDDNSSNFEIIFSGMFNVESKYRTTVWRMTNRIEKIASLLSSNKILTDCFTDCFSNRQFYTGIRSADEEGNQCLEWKKSKFSFQKFTRSNICSSSGDSKPWCPTNFQWKYCDVPSCSNIKFVTGCASVDQVKVSNGSMTTKWSNPHHNRKIIGYLTLLHNSDHQCQQFHIQLCRHCEQSVNLKNQVNNLYLSCKTGYQNQSILNETRFDNLHLSTQYVVYIIPIINPSAVGEIKRISVNT